MAYFTMKTWKDRLVEFAGRRTLKNVSTNESVTYDVTRAEGQVSQEGDTFSPANMNGLEQRIADGFSAAEAANNQLISDLAGLSFGQDEEGNWGYIPSGADAVIPFRGDWELILKITFGANQDAGSWDGYPTPTDSPGGWSTSITPKITCIKGKISISDFTGRAGRFGNQNNVAAFISNITVVSFSYL